MGSSPTGRTMIKIVTYTDERTKCLSFDFNNPKIEYDANFDWVEIKSPNHKLVFCDTSFVAFDSEIESMDADVYWESLVEDKIQQCYIKGLTALVISSNSNHLIKIFAGRKISLTQRYKNFTQFRIDDKSIWLYNVKFMTLSPNT